MKHIALFCLLFSLLAISFVTAEDRTSDPNDHNLVTGMDSDDTWRVDLTHNDILTNEDLNTDIKIEHYPQGDDDFDDHQDPDADLMDNDSDDDTTKALDKALHAQDRKANGDFDYDLIRREIIGEAHNNMEIKPEIDESDDDTDDADYMMNDVDSSEPEKSVDSVDDDLKPDNGKISTQVSGNDYDDEIEDSDDGDDADIIDDNDDSDDDAKIDLDYQQDDSGMADDDYVNEPKINEVANDNDYTMDDDDDGDSDGDDTDDFLSKDYLKYNINLDNIQFNITTVDINDDDDDDGDSNGDLNDIYYKTDDDDDSGDDDSDSDYDIYDSKYQEEPEKGGYSSDDDSSLDYDIFIDVDDSIWDSYLAADDDDVKKDKDLLV